MAVTVIMPAAKVSRTRGREALGVRESRSARKMVKGTGREVGTDMERGSECANATGRGIAIGKGRKTLIATGNANIVTGSEIVIATVTDTGTGTARMRRIATAGKSGKRHGMLQRQLSYRL